jgi:hypothetical protein
VVGHEGVWGVGCVRVFREREREKERDVTNEGQKNLLPLLAERLEEEDDKQCHRNGTILKFCFLSNSE